MPFGKVQTVLFILVTWIHLEISSFAYTDEMHTLLDVFGELQKSEAGQKLYTQLIARPNIRVEFSLGVSRTESVIKRFYDPLTQEESNVREVKVFLNRKNSLLENTLDLAHELIHALHEPTWSPYDVDLNVEKFIRISIESPGGEAFAIESECTVALDFLNSDSLPFVEKEGIKKRCSLFLNRDETKVDYNKLIYEIYKVGPIENHENFRFIKNIPFINFSKPTLYSSVADQPYPLALLMEYQYMNQVACRNTFRRIQSTQMPEPTTHARDFIQKRCESIQNP